MKKVTGKAVEQYRILMNFLLENREAPDVVKRSYEKYRYDFRKYYRSIPDPVKRAAVEAWVNTGEDPATVSRYAVKMNRPAMLGNDVYLRSLTGEVRKEISRISSATSIEELRAELADRKRRSQ